MGIDVIPRWERLLYWIWGIGGMVYSLYSFYREGQKKDELLDLRPGIKVLGGKKDSSDPEWANLCQQIPYLLPLLVGHVVVGQTLFSLKIGIWLQKLVRSLYDVLAIVFIFGVRPTLLCFLEALMMYLVTLQSHTSVVWLMSLLFTTTLNFDWLLQIQLRLVDCSEQGTIPFFISVSYVHIRLISACIDIIEQKNVLSKAHQLEGSASLSHGQKSAVDAKPLQKRYNGSIASKADRSALPFMDVSFLDFFSYIFYLPVFFQGPILTFDKFVPQVSAFYRSDSQNYDMKRIVEKILKIAFFALFIEIQSHFMYIQSVQEFSNEVWRTMSVPSVIGLCLWQGQYFHLKYLCLFGIPSLFYTLDGLEPIPLPACISWIYSFSDMWKYFDVGLYLFIKRYIYIPWGGSKAGLLYQILGTVSAFLYVCYWHGADASVLIWCCGNLVIILLEISASRFENSVSGSKWKSHLGASNVLRLKGLVATPLYVASALQVMYFFFSVETGSAMVDKMVWKASWKALLLEYIGFYCCIQNAMFIRKWLNSVRGEGERGKR